MADPSAGNPPERPGLLFYLLVAAAAFYLLVRLGQGIWWLVEKL